MLDRFLRVERLLHVDVRLYLGGISCTGKVVTTYDVIVDINFNIASSRSCLGCGCRSRCLNSNGKVAFEQGIVGGHALDIIRDHLRLNRLRYLHRLVFKLKGRFVNLPRL